MGSTGVHFCFCVLQLDFFYSGRFPVTWSQLCPSLTHFKVYGPLSELPRPFTARSCSVVEAPNTSDVWPLGPIAVISTQYYLFLVVFVYFRPFRSPAPSGGEGGHSTRTQAHNIKNTVLLRQGAGNGCAGQRLAPHSLGGLVRPRPRRVTTWSNLTGVPSRAPTYCPKDNTVQPATHLPRILKTQYLVQQNPHP